MLFSSLLSLAVVLPSTLAASRHFPHDRPAQKRHQRLAERDGSHWPFESDSPLDSLSGSSASPKTVSNPVEAPTTSDTSATLVSSSAASLSTPASKGENERSSGFNYGTDKIRGVNLGAWLVLEEWLLPGLFNSTGNPNIVDEWTWGELQPKSQAESLIQQHWDTFITEDDFKQIAAYGMSHVRIPIGYWAYQVGPGEPYITGQDAYMEKATQWARTYGLHILIDLHGAPGSQNGEDHSGHAGSIGWFNNATNVNRTIEVIQIIASKYGASEYSDVVTMIELLNEPSIMNSAQNQQVLKQYYMDAYQVARQPWGPTGAETDLIVVLQDGFMPMTWWGGFMTGNPYTNVWMDNHYYQAFTSNYGSMNAGTHIKTACSEITQNFDNAQLPIIDGEWSMGLYGCTASTSTTPNVGNCDPQDPAFNDQNYAVFTRAYFDVQTQAFENTGKGQGWFFWTWTNQANYTEWGYDLALQAGWFPTDPSQHASSESALCNVS